MYSIAFSEISAVGGEISLLAVAALLLLFRPKKPVAVLLTLLGICAALLLTLAPWKNTLDVFSGTYHSGKLEAYLKDIALIAGAISLFLLKDDKKIKLHFSEIVSLLIFMLCGAMIIVSARHLILTWLAFELLSVPAYALVGSIPSSSKGTEGGLKYAVFGGTASATMLYGFSLLYGAVGSLSYSNIQFAFSNSEIVSLSSPLIIISLVMIIVGIMFKLSAAPFHYWVPDALEAASPSIAGFISVVPKIAGFGLLIILNSIFYGSAVWLSLIYAASILSMTFGNLAAIHQNNLQRLMAYSTIAHAGYMLAAASLGTQYGSFAILYYLTVYTFMNLGAFYIIGLSSEHSRIDELKGLSARTPFLSFCMAVILFSLTGLPPFGGLTGKLFIISAALMKEQHLLVGVLIINSVISLYYYARILKAMYFEKGEGEKIDISPISQTVIAGITAMLLILGIMWQAIGKIAEIAAGI